MSLLGRIRSVVPLLDRRESHVNIGIVPGRRSTDRAVTDSVVQSLEHEATVALEELESTVIRMGKR